MSLQYNRPQTVAEAAELLQQPGRRAVPLAGGTWLTPRLRTDVDIPGSLAGEVDVVVDLADLPLSYVVSEGEAGSGALRIGATTRLSVIMDDPLCQALAGGILAEAARRAGPLNLRNSATIGGCVAARGPVLELTLVLAALNGSVVFSDGSADSTLRTSRSDLLITEIAVPWPAGDVRGGLARVARTPADQPIVAAAAVVNTSGVRVVLGGVAQQELVVTVSSAVDLAEAVAVQLAAAQPIADFRGSAEYRQAMAPIIARRAVEAALR
ncbi:MAG: FAD binding domain-containing protein [Anaerolineae bacterium]|nr:FAD binding domain-containing protein [Anaerolineae bacterium]